MNPTLLEALNWRYATKKFDPTKIIPAEDLTTLLESIRLTPSSYGLQPVKILVVENPKTREEIKTMAWNQQQVVDASHLLILCHYFNPGHEEVEQYLELISNARNKPLASLEGFKQHLMKSLDTMGETNKEQWTSKQTYIVLGQLMLSCAFMGIDATPMEGFDKQVLNQYLQLEQRGLRASLLCPIGYRHEEDPYLSLAKVRKNHEALFEVI